LLYDIVCVCVCVCVFELARGKIRDQFSRMHANIIGSNNDPTMDMAAHHSIQTLIECLGSMRGAQ